MSLLKASLSGWARGISFVIHHLKIAISISNIFKRKEAYINVT
ncbi:MAG: hypothetical protein ACHQJ6_00730 [Candidatus Berkiellales bacterium]